MYLPRRAFTLVELLVVIGIIAVLIALLLPTLAGARRSANAVKCASHLRSLGQAIQMYVNEQQYHVPTIRADYPGGVALMWYDQLGRYLFKGTPSGTPASIINDPEFHKTLFASCPAFQFTLFSANPTRTATGYGLTLYPRGVGQPTNTYRDPGLPPLTTPSRYFKIGEFKNPANRALMADANGYNGLRAQDPDPLYYVAPPGNNNQGDIDYYRHGRQRDLSRPSVNVLFADYHVELIPPWSAWYAVRDPARREAGSDRGS